MMINHGSEPEYTFADGDIGKMWRALSPKSKAVFYDFSKPLDKEVYRTAISTPFLELVTASTENQNPQILEVGSGQGYLSAVMKEASAKIISLDLSHEGLFWSKDRSIPKAQARATDLPIPSNSIDGVMAKDLIPNFDHDNLVEFFREAIRVLIPNGIIQIIYSPRLVDMLGLRGMHYHGLKNVKATAESLGLVLVNETRWTPKKDDWYGKPNKRVILSFKKT